MSTGLMIDVAGLTAHAREHLGYTEWRSLTQEQVDRFADVAKRQVTGIDAFPETNARIGPQAPGELSGSDIDGVNP